MLAAPELLIKVNDSIVCMSSGPCTYVASFIDRGHSMTISGHIANCRAQLSLTIEFNGEDIGGQVERVHSDGQGYCQTSIQQNVTPGNVYSILFTVVENGHTYELAWTGKIMSGMMFL